MVMDDAMQKRWLAERQGGVGASELGIIMGAQAYGRNPLTLYLDKVGKPEPTEDDIDDFRRGHVYEPLALSLAAEATGVAIDRPQNHADLLERFCFDAPNGEHVRCTLDGICEDNWNAEAKAPRPHKFREYRDEGIADLYDWQVQAQLACRPEAPGCRFILYDIVGVKVHVLEIERDEEMIRRLLADAERWWQDQVEARMPPQAIGGTETKRLKLPAEYTLVEGDTWTTAVNEYAAAKATAKVADGLLREKKAMIQAAMKAAELPKVTCNGHRFIYTQQDGRRTFNKDLLAAELPELDLSKYETQGKPFPSFRHYPPKGE
jgi:predicted phage-related endonuclease